MRKMVSIVIFVKFECSQYKLKEIKPERVKNEKTLKYLQTLYLSVVSLHGIDFLMTFNINRTGELSVDSNKESKQTPFLKSYIQRHTHTNFSSEIGVSC